MKSSTQDTRVGWTKAEYDACPELAGRLHGRILDLEDCLRELAFQVGGFFGDGNYSGMHRAMTRAKELLKED